MQIKISNRLQIAVQGAIGESQESFNPELFYDTIFLALIDGKDSHLAHILNKFVKDWELHKIKLSIENHIGKYITLSKSLLSRHEIMAELMCNLSDTIDKLNTDNVTDANTGHFLLSILDNGNTCAAKRLKMYGVTAAAVSQYVVQLPLTEDYYEEINVLSRLGSSLVESAKAGKLDQVVGRNQEIERLIQILSRRKKCNPVLIGEAGVGKSAIVEGLALKIATNDVPDSLKGKDIFSLDLASLISGTRFRGDFEERIKTLLDQIAAKGDVILFIDEIHNIVGAGGAGGGLDGANILKSALARGDVRCIGATTIDEYRNNIEKDAALERRFQKVVVEPMTASQTMTILQKIKSSYEKHHNVEYSDGALVGCVDLSQRHLTMRNFPDKAIDLLDEAGAMARFNSDAGGKVVVELSHVEGVVKAMTGIPTEQLESSEREHLNDMNAQLSKVIVGQQGAVSRVVRSIRRGRTGLADPTKPLGVFMFVGPTGVGKTHLAKELSRLLFQSDDALIRVDMSEYSQSHNISRLIGSPPGYVGHSEGGQLTESVRRHPYSVVLFDEIEKAHPDLFNLMLQILDEGQLTDSLGRKIDFRNTIIIMTSNVGSAEINRKLNAVGYHKGGDIQPAQSIRESDYCKALEGKFAPEFINRVDDIVVFNTLDDEHMAQIVDIEIAKLALRAESIGFNIEVTPDARKKLATDGYESRYGVRSLRRTILDKLEEPFADMIIDGQIEKGDTVMVGVSKSQIEVARKVSA